MNRKKRIFIALAIITVYVAVYAAMFGIGYGLHYVTESRPRWGWFALAFLLGVFTSRNLHHARNMFRELTQAAEMSGTDHQTN